MKLSLKVKKKQPPSQRTKNEGRIFKNVPTIVELISPDGYHVDRDYIQVGKRYYRFYAVLDYPQSVYIGWLEDLKLLGNIDFTVHIFPGSPRDVIQQLTAKITQYTSQAMIDEEKGNIYDLGITKAAAQGLERLREDIQMNRDRLYYVTMIASVSANSLEELEKESKILEEALAAKTMRYRMAFLRQDEAFKTLAPVGINHMEDLSRNFNNGAAISLFPFASPEFSHKKGIPLGINLFTGSPIIFDNFIGPPALTNYNMGIFAQAGAGKSFLTKLLSVRGALLDIKTVFIDPEGEYSLLTEKVGGTVVKIEVEGENIINPFDLEEEENEGGNATVDLLQKVADIKGLISFIVEGVTHDRLSAVELAVIEDAVQEEYRSRGISKDPASLYDVGVSSSEGFYIGRKKKEMPTLSSFVERLSFKKDGERVATILRPFLRGGTMGIFDGQSNVRLKDVPLICFDIFGIKDEFMRTYAMYVITNWVWEKFAKKDVRQKKRVVVDEAWMFMKYKDTANFIENLSRRGRKRNTSLTVASQSFMEFSNSPEGKAILTNTPTVVLMKQSPTDIDAVQEIFHLSEGERNFLLSCGVGEGLLLAGRNATAIKVVSSDYEREFVETNPNR